MLRAAGSILRMRADEFAALITLEMGKPLAEARSEVIKCGTVCDYYAKHGRAFLAEERPPGAAENVRIVFEPLGVVLAIMPWNFPFWQVFRAAAPALMAGNTLLLKHSPNVCGCALAIAEVFRSAAARARSRPAHLLQALLLPAGGSPPSSPTPASRASPSPAAPARASRSPPLPARR